MEISLMLAEQILSLVLICIVGFLITYFKIISSAESRVISRICVYVIIPCSMINAFQTELDQARLSGLGLAFVGAILIHMMYLGATKLLDVAKVPLDNVERASIIYNNAGNLVIPMVAGTLGTEYIFYTSAYIAVQNFLMWSHGQIIMGVPNGKSNFKKIFKNPCMISIFIGVSLFLFQIKIPGAVGIAISSSAACLGPLSMLMIGMMLGEQNLKKIFSSLKVYRIVVIRLILYPLLTMIVLFILSKLWVHNDINNILLVSLLCAIGPSAATVAQQAQLYDHPLKVYVSSINVVSTSLCAITMPLMALLFQFILS
ncbi:hypothetical protein AN641_05510 [Candidatus Epulonipiscioides gigas]|nr:hypothetical protein AN641_05510 [Epulopiscium sp. SCG-C07WGA-EpuloA2]